MAKLSTKKRALLFKTQSVEGVFETGMTAVDNGIIVENLQVSLEVDQLTSNENTGSLDANEGDSTGGVKATVTFEINIANEGTPGDPARFGDILKACGTQEVVTAAIAPEACAAGGSTTTVVLGTSASSVDDAYRGQPLVLTGAVVASTTIVSYDGATKTATVADTLPGSPGVTTNYSIPANVSYRPASTAIPRLSLSAFTDGIREDIEGARCNLQVVFQTRELIKLRITAQGAFLGRFDAAAPTISYSRDDLLRFMDATASIDRSEVGLTNITLDFQNQIVQDDNPNATYGYDAPDINERRLQVSMDPVMQLVATRDTIGKLLAGSESMILARAGEPGNGFSMMVPRALMTGYSPGERNSTATEQLTFAAKGADAGAILCVY